MNKNASHQIRSEQYETVWQGKQKNTACAKPLLRTMMIQLVGR